MTRFYHHFVVKNISAHIFYNHYNPFGFENHYHYLPAGENKKSVGESTSYKYWYPLVSLLQKGSSSETIFKNPFRVRLQ
jgi:hypothetical protein